MTDSHHDMAQWFEANHQPLMLYARQWLDEQAVADVVQDAFLKLLSQRPRPRDVRAWLFRAVRNAALNELRRRQTRDRYARNIAAGAQPWFQSNPDDAMDADLAQQALRQLAPEQGELIVMRIWGQMTFEQMAEVTNVSASTVYERYVAAIEQLRRRMVTSWESIRK